MRFDCALCPRHFPDEIARARHFAETHPIRDPEELKTLLGSTSVTPPRRRAKIRADRH